jgi:DNA-binding GntR family transcriptional regulator
MDELHTQGKVDEYSQVNRDFHMTLYQASQAKMLYTLIDDLWSRSERSMWFSPFSPIALSILTRNTGNCFRRWKPRRGPGRRDTAPAENGRIINVIKILKEYERVMR